MEAILFYVFAGIIPCLFYIFAIIFLLYCYSRRADAFLSFPTVFRIMAFLYGAVLLHCILCIFSGNAGIALLAMHVASVLIPLLYVRYGGLIEVSPVFFWTAATFGGTLVLVSDIFPFIYGTACMSWLHKAAVILDIAQLFYLLWAFFGRLAFLQDWMDWKPVFGRLLPVIYMLVAGSAVMYANWAGIGDGSYLLMVFYGAMHLGFCFLLLRCMRGDTEFGMSGDAVNGLYRRRMRDDESLKDRLIEYFETEKPFLSKNLTLDEVALKLFTSKVYLSKIINCEMKKNFRELVNHFRIKEAMRIFCSDTGMSITELRDRCGFNNNASFTSAFKVNTGYTPGEWCRNIKSRRENGIRG